ncbi:MAG: HAD family hydrolase, partial [Pseudomonadota bacterium]|nr:HAD family hydrolase [Pseudomonadota bacterium]
DETLDEDSVWPLLQQFFREEMSRQTPVPGAVEALGRIGEVADIVVLTNLGDEAHGWRVEQLASHGIRHEVVTNQGGKGVPARAIIKRHSPSVTAFVDDLPVHHRSVARHAPEVWRVHMVAEPRLAPNVPHAEWAHVRIDHWDQASRWILDKFGKGQTA